MTTDITTNTDASPTTHEGILAFVTEVAELTQPDAIHWCTGDDDEWNQLTEQLVPRPDQLVQGLGAVVGTHRELVDLAEPAPDRLAQLSLQVPAHVGEGGGAGPAVEKLVRASDRQLGAVAEANDVACDTGCGDAAIQRGLRRIEGGRERAVL